MFVKVIYHPLVSKIKCKSYIFLFCTAAPKQEETYAPPPPLPTSAPPAPIHSSIPGNLASQFAPVLPPVVDLKPSSAPAQPGVPTGAGSKPAPKKGRGQLMKETAPGRIPICGDCGEPIR